MRSGKMLAECILIKKNAIEYGSTKDNPYRVGLWASEDDRERYEAYRDHMMNLLEHLGASDIVDIQLVSYTPEEQATSDMVSESIRNYFKRQLEEEDENVKQWRQWNCNLGDLDCDCDVGTNRDLR